MIETLNAILWALILVFGGAGIAAAYGIYKMVGKDDDD